MSRRNVASGHTRRSVLATIAAGTGVVGVAGCLAVESGDVLVDDDGEQVSLTLVSSTATANTEDTGEYIADQLESELGVAVEHETSPSDSLFELYAKQVDEDGNDLGYNAGDRDVYTSENDWDLLWGINLNTYPRSPEATASFWAADGQTNFFGYEPEEDIGELLSTAAREPDLEERRSTFQSVFITLSEDLPVNFLQFSQEIDGYRSEVVHTESASLDGMGWGHRYQTWHFEDAYEGENRYTTAISGEVQTTNVYHANDTLSLEAIRPVLDGTYVFDSDDELHGRWFESVETDDDQVYECTLRDNLRWSDPYGAMTTADWEFFVENVVTYEDNWAAHGYRNSWWIDGEPIEFEAIDDRRFRLHLPRANPAFLYSPALWGQLLVPKDLTEPYFESYVDGDEQAGVAFGEDEDVLSLAYTGNLGPYRLVERRVEDRFIYERNEDYYMREHGGDEWTEAPYFDEYVIRIIGEESTRLAELEAGGLTHAQIPEDDAASFDERDDVTVVQNASPYCSVMCYNQRANGWGPLRTREVRHAIAYAIDKEVITDDIYAGYADVAQTFQPSWSVYYDDSAVRSFGVGDTYDPERARDLLAEALPDEYRYE